MALKNPEVESRESIMQYACSVGLDTFGHRHCRFTVLHSCFKRIGPVFEAEIFSKNGETCCIKNVSTDCNAGLFYFIPGCVLIQSMQKGQLQPLKNNWPAWEIWMGKTISPAGLENADYFYSSTGQDGPANWIRIMWRNRGKVGCFQQKCPHPGLWN